MFYKIYTNLKIFSFLLIISIIFFPYENVLMGKSSSKTAGKHASIHFPVKSHHFGKVTGGKIVSHNFIFYNRGDGILAIENISAGWGCTAALVTRDRIPAGGRGELEVRLNTERRTGKIEKTVKIFSNDPLKPVVYIKVSAVSELSD